jgi:hypothetical protein
MHSTKPIIHALAATFLALGNAAGEKTLQRAGGQIRELIADKVVGPETVEILEDILAGIDYGARASDFAFLDEVAA